MSRKNPGLLKEHGGPISVSTESTMLEFVDKAIVPYVMVLSSEFYFHNPITVHLELYLFYCFIHFYCT